MREQAEGVALNALKDCFDVSLVCCGCFCSSFLELFPGVPNQPIRYQDGSVV